MEEPLVIDPVPPIEGRFRLSGKACLPMLNTWSATPALAMRTMAVNHGCVRTSIQPPTQEPDIDQHG
jgi:hypothetical protein